MKLFLLITLLVCVSCLPKEAGSSEPIEAARLQPQECQVAFEKNQTLPRIAETAQKIKTDCGLSEAKLIELAKKTFN